MHRLDDIAFSAVCDAQSAKYPWHTHDIIQRFALEGCC